MYYLHVELKIIHRDLKGENVFLEEIGGDSNRIMVKIGDFGLAINTVNTKADKQFNLGTLVWQVFTLYLTFFRCSSRAF